MKKILLSVFALCAFAAVSNAQISGGLKAGLNFANQNYDADGLSISPDARTAFHFGAFANLSLSDNLGLQPELLYSAQGSEFDGSESNVNYLTLPVLVRYNINDMFSAHVGPQLGFLLSAEDEDGNDFSDSVTGTDLGLAFGAQVDLPVGFVGGVRYILGLSDINDDDTASALEVRNRNFQIYVGYKLFGN